MIQKNSKGNIMRIYLKRLRQQLNLKTEYLSCVLKKSKGYYSKYENGGIKVISFEDKKKLCKSLQLHTTEQFDEIAVDVNIEDITLKPIKEGKLLELRKRYNFNSSDVELFLQTESNNYYHVEIGQIKTLKYKYLERLAKLYHLTVENLIKELYD
jgi:transcriptional regulator with XRE-family HTH domain